MYSTRIVSQNPLIILKLLPLTLGIQTAKRRYENACS